MFDVNASLIRFWEQKFDILKPDKNKKGNRLFTPADVDNLKLIYHLVKENGMTLAGARKRLKENREGIERNLEIIEKLQGIKSLLLEIRQELKAGDTDGTEILVDSAIAESLPCDLPVSSSIAEITDSADAENYPVANEFPTDAGSTSPVGAGGEASSDKAFSVVVDIADDPSYPDDPAEIVTDNKEVVSSEEICEARILDSSRPVADEPVVGVPEQSAPFSQKEPVSGITEEPTGTVSTEESVTGSVSETATIPQKDKDILADKHGITDNGPEKEPLAETFSGEESGEAAAETPRVAVFEQIPMFDDPRWAPAEPAAVEPEPAAEELEASSAPAGQDEQEQPRRPQIIEQTLF